MTIVNGPETIPIEDIAIKNDSIYIEMPIYGTFFTGMIESDKSINGHWHKPSKGADYQIPFQANFIKSGDESDLITESDKSPIFSKYQVRFSPDTDNEYPAIGLFSSDQGDATGTFLTETGDYRFLSGRNGNGNLILSCFDGSHLFQFEAETNKDSLYNGVFYSGNHWKENWEATFDPDAKLSHPDSITYLIDDSPMNINVMSVDGDLTTINQDMFLGKVTILQIFGTWCPNCLDETLFYKDVHHQYSDQGLQIIPVDFELSDDFQMNSSLIKYYHRDLELPYEIFLGGSHKSGARELFNNLNNVSSFPTSIFIDGTGTVRRIHTGFYGPGTGEYYNRYTEEFHHFVMQLLSELENEES